MALSGGPASAPASDGRTTATPHQLSIAFGRKLFYTALLAKHATITRERHSAQELEIGRCRRVRVTKGHSIEGAVDAVLARIGAIPFLVLVALAMLIPGFFTLPPMDRDEPRFAQASKQMLETSDFVAIRFGDEARNKKPVGIHWLQAAAVGTADLLHVPNARQRIWIYRVPSLLGAILAVLLTYWAALPIVEARSAVLAAVLLAATPLLGVEARLATTDAVLAATVTAVMGALVRVYLADEVTRRRLVGNAIVFWAGLGIGILIKGPINPLIPSLAAIVLSLRQRSAQWLWGLRPLPGLVVCLLIVLPWFVLILLKTNGTFFTDAVGHDLLGKVAGGQEMHGAPPGFYLATVWLTAWPFAPFTALAVPSLWRSWRDPKIACLLAWCVPLWLILEGVVTKLVHYALPLYPALAILAVLGVERATEAGRSYRAASGWVLFLLLATVPTVVLALVFGGQGRLWVLDPLATGVAVLAMATAVWLAWRARQVLLEQRPRAAMLLAALAAVPLYLFVYGWLLLPSVAPSLAVSPRLVREAEADLGPTCPHPGYATVGSREPSLMFATNEKLLMTDPLGAARFLDDSSCRVAFVEAREEQAFKAALDPAAGIRLASRVDGVAVNGGRKLDIGVYIRQ